MKAVILAGGKGTRMGELTLEIPKPMLKIAGKPVLEYQINLLKEFGFKEAIILVNHLKDRIIEYFGNGEKFGISIQYFVEEVPLGTVGGIKAIEEKLNEDFLVLYGDVLVNMDLNRLIQFHKNKGGVATLVVHPNDHPHDSDLLDTDDEMLITRFYPKPHQENVYYRNLVNAALYVFSPDIINHLIPGQKADFGKDIFPELIKKEKVYAYNTSEYLKDMGTPSRIEKVEKDLLSGLIEAKNLKQQQVAIFIDRDGVINEDSKDFIKSPDELKVYDFVSPAIKKANQSKYLSIVCTNQSGLARNLFNVETLQQIHHKLETELGFQGAKLDAIYYCPHHPHSGFEGENKALKIDCDCRKPKPGMLIQAAKDFHINLHESFMVGDSERDILAGNAAGCTTIGVRTGNGLKNSSTSPDYLFNDLDEAIDFITNPPHLNSLPKVTKWIEGNSGEKLVILLGGNTRSGKSTFAMQVKKNLERLNIGCQIILLDMWIKPKNQRIGNENFEERFQLRAMKNDIQELLKKQYHSTEINGTKNDFDIRNHQVIIIEGVPALELKIPNEFKTLKLFKSISDQELQKRIEKYYLTKGLDSEEIKSIIAIRREDEYRRIEAQKELCDFLVD